MPVDKMAEHHTLKASTLTLEQIAIVSRMETETKKVDPMLGPSPPDLFDKLSKRYQKGDNCSALFFTPIECSRM